MKSSMKRRAWQSLSVLLFVLMIAVGSNDAALADVNIGDYIDSTNWQKVQGMVPEAVLDYLKKGWITMKIGKLNYEPGDFWFYTEGLKRNRAKYDIAEDGQMQEKATGVKSPLDFVAAPFPLQDLDPKDSKMPMKFFYNVYMNPNAEGSSRQTATLSFFGSRSFERYIAGPQKNINFIANELNIKNQKYAEQFGSKDTTLCFIMRVTDPYELNGLATMTYGYLGKTSDRVFAYVPALRRVRTMTAGARSDSMFGTDYSLDDSQCGWWGKPADFNIKYIRTQEALVQYASPDPLKYIPQPDGSILLQKEYFEPAKFGYKVPGWKGKPWAITNSIWVKRKVYVFEATAKDPYYNYGKMEIWADTKAGRGNFKIINDHAGKRWKVMIMNSHGGYAINNYPWGFGLCARGDVIYDEQRDHATSVEEYKPGELKNWNAKTTPDEFTLTGLSKLGK